MATKRPPRIPVPEVTQFDPLPDTQNLRTPRYQAQGAPAQPFAPQNPNVTPERLESLRAARAAPAPTAAPAAAPTAAAPAQSLRAAQPGRLSTLNWRANDYLKNGLPNQTGPRPPSAAPASAVGRAAQAAKAAPGRAASTSLRFLGRTAGPFGGIAAAGEEVVSATGKALDGDYQGAAVDTGRGVAKGAGAWAGGALGAKAGALAGLATGPAAPIAAPILTAAGGIGGAFVGQEGVEKAYDWAADKFGLRPASTMPVAPTVAPANSGIRTQNVVEGLNTRGLTSSTPGPGRVLRDNFDPELAKLPAELPSGLRQGVVHRTLDANGRPVYSGSNVGVNPQFVDGAGKTVTPGGFMGEIPGMSPSLRTAMAGSGGPVARVEPGVQGGGMAGFGPTQAERDLANRRRSAEFYADSRDRRTRERGQRELDALDRAALAQGANETSLRNAGAQADAARYGADRRLEGDALQAEATVGAANLRGRQASAAAQVERQAQTLAMQQANGDRRAAARILDSMGFSGAKLLSSEASEQGLQVKNREDSEALLKSLSAGEDGKIDAARLARNQAVANDITGGRWSTMTPTERAKRQDDVRRGIQLLEGLNQYRDSTWAKRAGWDNTVEEFSSLPDVKGATITRLGAVEGAGTARAEKGDWKIRTQKGEVLYVPSSAVDQASLDMLKEMGAKIDTKD